MSLNKCRKEIDKLDLQIIELLNKRAKFALKIGIYKNDSGKDLYAPDREFQIYKKIYESSKGPLSSECIKLIYREIISASLSLERKLKIAYLGPEATYTHLAALSRFGNSVKYKPLHLISDVFKAVEKNKADYGVVPIENSTEGAVTNAFDMFLISETKICTEVIYDIHLQLISKTSLDKVKRIYSHPQAFSQCRLWLEMNMPDTQLIEESSTTEAAVKAQVDEYSASISSELAAKLYGLSILEESIEDCSQNSTRFLVIGKNYPKTSGHDKSTIVFSLNDSKARLNHIIGIFNSFDIPIIKMETRPNKEKAWDWYYFIDFEGHVEDKNIANALKKMSNYTDCLKILGSYPNHY